MGPSDVKTPRTSSKMTTTTAMTTPKLVVVNGKVPLAADSWLQRERRREYRLAQSDMEKGRRRNYVGFELRGTLTEAANEVVRNSALNGYVKFVQGEAKSIMHTALTPFLSNGEAAAATEITGSEATETNPTSLGNSYIEWLTIQFPDPWTKKKHHKRRLVDARFVADCAVLMQDARSHVYLCSDRYDLACFMYDTFAASALWQVVPNVDDVELGTAPPPMAPMERLPSEPGSLEEALDDSASVDSSEMWCKGVYREKDVDDPRRWLARRPFAVGTERDTVAERQNRPVHRAIFRRVI